MVDLDRLGELGDTDFINEMIELFVSVSAEQMAEIKSAVARTDAVALSRAAHKLKGSSLGMFATTVAKLAETLEHNAEPESASELVGALETAMDETKSQMSSLAKSR